MTLMAGILVGVLVVWEEAAPSTTRITTLMFLTALGVTAVSLWHTHFRHREVGQNFLYGHVIFDVLLVTTIIYVTTPLDTSDPGFVPLYILVITEGALLLPLPGGVLIGALASIMYFAGIVYGNSKGLTGTVPLQIGLFTVVALLTGWLGDRLQRAGVALGAVRSELQRLRLDTGDILGSISTGVLTIDGGERLVYMNRAAEDLLQLSRRQWEGLPVLDAVEAVAPGLGTVLRRTMRERRPMARFKTVARGERSEVTLGISTTVLDRAGELDEPPSVTAIFQDITDLERLEILNRRTERLEAVAELSASLAHEIKNPLASIRSAVEQISNPTLSRSDQQILQRLVVGESDRLSRLLSEFLEFTALRINSQADLDLSKLVCDSIALVRQHPDAGGGVQIQTDGVDEGVFVPGDADLLHRVIFNLVLNAVQFAGDNGRVVVEVEDCSGAWRPRGIDIANPVRVSVRDNGPGIAPDAEARIFDPFFTTRPGGNGLGLSVVHRAVEVHGGALFVEKAPEGGAHFVIYLPGDPALANRHERVAT